MKFSAMRVFALLAVLMLVFVAGQAVFASTTGIVAGVVTDSDTGAKLSGVNIVIHGTSLTTVTDAKGYFVITNVAPGAYSVTASLVGYSDETKSDVQVMMDATTTIDIELSKTEIEAPTKVIVGTKKNLLQPDMAPTLYVMPSRQEKMVKNQPNKLYQIPGLVATQPGVTLDASGAPHIRGGRDNEIGYMLEGIPVTEPLTNIFGTNTVTVGMSKMQVYTGGYRAEYGNAISGVFNEIKKTGSEALGGNLEMTGGGQSYKGSYLEYGGSVPNGFDYYIGSYDWKSDFERQDAAGTRSSDTLAKFVFPKGNDKYTLLVNQGSARYFLDSIHDFTYQHVAVTPENDHGHQGYNLLGVTWSHNFSPSSFFTFRPYELNTKSILDALSPDGPMGTYLDYGTRQKGLQFEYTNQFNENHLFKTGTSVIHSKNRYKAWVPDLGEAFGQPDWGDYYYNSNVATTQTGAFIQDQAKLNEKLRLEVGLRYDEMKFNKVEHADKTESQTSPRYGLSYSLDTKNVLKASWGRFIQFPPSYVTERVYENDGWLNYKDNNADLKPERSTSWDLSWERQINDSTMARVTPFHRTYTDLLQSQKVNPDDPDSMVSTYANAGRGNSSGVELYVSKKMSKNWEGWLSYTYMKARANASSFTSTIDPSIWSYVDWDQRQTLNVVFSYTHKDWEHNFQINYGSGLADSVTASTASLQGHSPSNTIVSWNISKKLPQGSLLGDRIYLNVWNVFNTGRQTHATIYGPDAKEADGWVSPRFITLGTSKQF